MFAYIKRLRYLDWNTMESSPEEISTAEPSGTSFSDEDLGKLGVSSDLSKNIELIRKILDNSSDIVMRDFTLGRKDCRNAAIIYLNNMIDSHHIDNDIIRPLVIDSNKAGFLSVEAVVGQLGLGNLITRGQIKTSGTIKELVYGILEGDACLLISKTDAAFLISVRGNETRSINEAQNEPVIRGPKDAFVESLKVNIGLIRVRLLNPNLTFETLEIGCRSHTKVCLTYIRGVCPISRIAEVRSRLKRINTDGILESGYLEEFIQDSPFSIFPQIRNTERPDVVSAALLEGRVAIITDNTPIAMIAPGELISLLQSAEDYYDRFVFASLIRILRLLGLFLATTLPAFFIAVTTYHKEMVPTDLLISIAEARIGVPISTLIEAFAMNFALELLYEAGVRLPKSLGQTISIVGALIIGQAAVQARLVSPLTVIVISLTAIATFCIPQYNFALPVRIIRFLFMILASMLGMFGVMIGALYLLLHLTSLRSFGVAYLAPLSPVDLESSKDTIIRSPWWALVKRPSYISPNRNRTQAGQKPKPPGL